MLHYFVFSKKDKEIDKTSMNLIENSSDKKVFTDIVEKKRKLNEPQIDISKESEGDKNK